MAAGRLAIFDVDGTLVDSTYHHALAWQRAFRACEITLPMWRIHRQIGKGGDRLVSELAGDEVERAHGDGIRQLHEQRYGELIDEVVPLSGAHELLVACKDDGWRVALASSGRPHELRHYLDALDVEPLLDAILTSADVDVTKPAPDLFAAAHERAGGDLPTSAVLAVGDSPWDCTAAREAGMTAVGVLWGGFCRQELEEAGAAAVFADCDALRRELGSLLPTGP